VSFCYNDKMPRLGLFATLRDTTFRSLRHRNYRRYFLGQIVSFIGSWMQSAALMWLLYDRTGDPRWPSWVLVAQVGPTVLLGTWGGGLADRLSRRKLIIATQSAFLVHATLLTLLIAFNLIPPVLVLVLMAVSGVIQAVDLPARLAFLPDLVPTEDLINAVGLNSLLFNSARALGPALAALLFLVADSVVPLLPAGTSAVTAGAVACFALNAVSFLAVLIALLGIVDPAATLVTRSCPGGTWDGFRYLRERSALGALVILTLVLCVFGWPLITILPAYTRTQLGRSEQTFGLLVSAVGLGALAASLMVATFATAARRSAYLVGGPTIAALGLLGVAIADRPEAAALGCAAAGFGLVLYLSTGQSTLQLAVPADRRGRVLALWAMTLSASAPIGHLLAGHAVTLVGVRPVVLAMSAGAAVSTGALALLVSRSDLR
jgi:MFS family permease